MSVKLRKKKTKKGNSLYLDIYHNGQRQYEFLKIHLTKDKESNKEKMRIAESIRAKKEIEILSGAHGLTPKFKKKANFVEYFEKFASKIHSTTNYTNTLSHLKEFTGGTIKFLQINEKWLEEFKGLPNNMWVRKHLKRRGCGESFLRHKGRSEYSSTALSPIPL